LPAPPPNFADAATLRARTPQELFTTITTGRLDVFMPPFADTLTEPERWDAVAYLYTLGTTATQLEAGQAVWAAECAACHGETGQGQGPEAASLTVPDLTSPGATATRSNQAWLDLLAGGDEWHAFGSLPEADRLAVVDFTRALSYEYADPAEALAERAGTVTGQLANQTAGATGSYAGVEVLLHSFENDSLLETFTTTVDAEGGYAFANVAFTPGRQFLATVEYQGVTYGSEPAAFDPREPILLVDIPVYEPTTDTAVLSVDQLHVFLQFDPGGPVTVGELYIFSNNGDRAFAAQGAGVLRFDLPDGATDLSVRDGVEGQTYFLNADGFSSATPIYPGSGTGQVLFSYRLPDASRLEFSQVMAYPVAEVNLMLDDPNMVLTGPGLTDLGLQTVQDQQFRSYNRSGLARGDTLSFSVQPQTGLAAWTSRLAANDRLPLALGLGTAALLLLGIGTWLYLRGPLAGQPEPGAPAPAAGLSDDELIAAIADLDEAYEAGDLAEGEYERDRAALKTELTSRWGE
jgi:mono/diheme cytochrome c family protein